MKVRATVYGGIFDGQRMEADTLFETQWAAIHDKQQREATVAPFQLCFSREEWWLVMGQFDS